MTDQASLNFNYARLLRDRWLAGALIGFESNNELGIELRTTVGGGIDHTTLQTEPPDFNVINTLERQP